MHLGGRAIAMGIGFVLIGVAIAFGLVGYLVPGLPQPVLGAIGGAIGVAAWLSYLRKRND